MSRRVRRPLSGVLLAVLVAALIVSTAVPATAHWPEIEASSRCDAQGRPWIDYESWSWKQDPARDGESGNPNIGIYIGGTHVDQGSFTAVNGYQFGGTILATAWEGLTVTVRARADAPFNNGSSQGSFRETSVLVPDDCLPSPVPASVLVTPRACRFEEGVSRTSVEVSMVPDGAATVTLRSGDSEVEITTSGSVDVTPGLYSWTATANEGFALEGKGSGEFLAGSCEDEEPSVTDLAVSKLGPSGTVLAGDTIAYTVTVTNNGPSAEPTAVVVDTLPVAVDFSSATPSQGTCTAAAGVVTCTLGSLPVGGTAVIVMVVETPTAGRHTNVAVVTGQVHDDHPANNRAEASTDVFEVSPATSVTAVAPTTTAPSTTTTTPTTNPTATTGAETPAPPAGTEPLPFTGREEAGWAGVGFSLVALGCLVLLAVARRGEEPASVWIGTTWRSSRRRNTVNLLRKGDG